MTDDNGLTFQANLTQPGAERPAARTGGIGQGLTTNLGNAPGNVWTADRVNPEYWRFSFGVERQLPGDFLVEVSYIGQRGTNLPILETLNFVPQQFRTQSPIRDTDAETFLTQVVSNPFQGLTPDSPASNGATIARRRLLYSLPAVRRERHLHRQRHVLHGDRARLEHVPRRDLPRSTSASRNGLMLMTLLHVVAPAREASPRSIRGTSSKIASPRPIGRIASRLPAWPSCPSAADAAAAATGMPSSTRILGGWQFSDELRMAERPAAGVQQNTYFDPACGDPEAAASRNGAARQRQYPRRRRADHRHQLLLHDERPAVPQRGRASR